MSRIRAEILQVFIVIKRRYGLVLKTIPSSALNSGCDLGQITKSLRKTRIITLLDLPWGGRINTLVFGTQSEAIPLDKMLLFPPPFQMISV